MSAGQWHGGKGGKRRPPTNDIEIRDLMSSYPYEKDPLKKADILKRIKKLQGK
jgi:hypothetical protein